MSAAVNAHREKLQQLAVAIRQTQQDIDNLDDDRSRITRKIDTLKTIEASLLDAEQRTKSELDRIKAKVAANVTTTRTLLDSPQA